MKQRRLSAIVLKYTNIAIAILEKSNIIPHFGCTNIILVKLSDVLL